LWQRRREKKGKEEEEKQKVSRESVPSEEARRDRQAHDVEVHIGAQAERPKKEITEKKLDVREEGRGRNGKEACKKKSRVQTIKGWMSREEKTERRNFDSATTAAGLLISKCSSAHGGCTKLITNMRKECAAFLFLC